MPVPGASQAWRARIETIDGRHVLGTGFLIDSTRVITCAHIVERHTKVRVTFLGAFEPVSAEAEVDFRGPWRADSDLGDVAVIVLSCAVPIRPASLASPTAMRDRRLDPVFGELHAYGFPRGFDDEGADSRVCAPYGAPHRGEWFQLEPVGQRGISLQKGFSGAAVTLADTGEVVGMVVGAERSSTTGTGKMLPLRAIEYYWPQIGDHLPLADLSAAAAHQLRSILDTAQVEASPSEIYRSSLPSGIGPAPASFATLWDAARFVAEEVIEASGDRKDSPLARFCVVLLRRISAQRKKIELREWMRGHLAMDHGELCLGLDDQEPDAGLVVVRIVPSAERQQFSLTVSAVVGRSRQVLYSGRQREKQIRDTVQRVLPEALKCIPEQISNEDLVVLFELPLSWLGKPVDEWCVGELKDRRIGWTYPVVVRDLGSADDRRRLVRKRWQVLRGQTKSALQAVDCRDTRSRRSLMAWLLAGGERSILALSSSPRNPESHSALRAGLAVGIAVMLWTRTKCTDDHDHATSCEGDRFLELLRDALESTPPLELPERVRRLRAHAYAADSELHRCKAVTLFWYDPEMAPPDQSPLVLAE